VSALVVIGVVAACSSSTGTNSSATLSDAQINTDLAGAAGVSATTQGDEFVTQDSEAGAAGRIVGRRGPSALALPMRRTRAEGGCTTGSFNGTIVFPASMLDTASISQTWEFFAAGVCENAYVSGTTDSIVFSSTTTAELHTANGFGSTHHEDTRSNWVTGSPALSSATTRVWNGFEDGVDTISISGDISESRVYDAAASDTLVNVTYPHPLDGAVYPVSGSYNRWVAASVTYSGPTTGSKQVARHIVITFNGNEVVPIVVYDASSGAVDLSCQFDLGLGVIVAGSCST